MNSVYTVPIIPQNLRREETIVQIADSLKYLSEVANDIFNRVNARIETNRIQLTDLSKRIDTAKEKIWKLKGAKKATQVFSSCKYPAIDVHQQYQSLFNNNNVPVFIRTRVKFKDVQLTDETLESLQFYHVKINKVEDQESLDGLGEIPKDIKSVNDLLLYNSGKNPYKHYVMSDPLQTSLRFKKDDSSDTSDIGAAPHSIVDKSVLTKSATESFFYSPNLGDVPTIDVPLDLPDLPGIADDLRYVDELGPGIAPSVTTTPNVPELPLFEEQPEDKETTELELPLPPDEKMEISTPLPQQPSPEPISEPKPEPELEKIPAPTIDSLTKPPVDISDAHASLMDAIRKAGGSKNAKLRQAMPKKPAAPSSDLMADLHAKLSMRRKGISGAKLQESGTNIDSSSAMSKVSAMIPPPPTKNDAESTNTEDEDWDE